MSRKRLMLQPLTTSTIVRYELRVTRVALGEEVAPYGELVDTSSIAAKVLHGLLDGLEQEAFIVLHLNARGRLMGYHEAGRGSSTAVTVHPAQVFQTAIANGAHAIILGHNHPSGDPRPSVADRDITRRLQEGAALLSIKLLDHVIVGGDRHCSFQDDGLFE